MNRLYYKHVFTVFLFCIVLFVWYKRRLGKTTYITDITPKFIPITEKYIDFHRGYYSNNCLNDDSCLTPIYNTTLMHSILTEKAEGDIDRLVAILDKAMRDDKHAFFGRSFIMKYIPSSETGFLNKETGQRDDFYFVWNPIKAWNQRYLSEIVDEQAVSFTQQCRNSNVSHKYCDMYTVEMNIKRASDHSPTGEGISEYGWLSEVDNAVIEYRTFSKKLGDDLYLVSYSTQESPKNAPLGIIDLVERSSLLVFFGMFLATWIGFVDASELANHKAILFIYALAVFWFMYNGIYQQAKLKNKTEEEDSFIFKESNAFAIAGVTLGLALFLKEMLQKRPSFLKKGNKLLAISLILLILMIFDPISSPSSKMFRLKSIVKHHIFAVSLVFIGVSVIYSSA